MSADTIERLQVEFGADLGPLLRAFEQAKREGRQYSTDITKAADATGGKLAQAAGLAAINIRAMVAAAAGGSMVAFGKSAVDTAAALEKMARNAGLTHAAFQSLQIGAKQSGFDGDIAPALAKFAENAQLARSKAGELFETLKFASPILADQLAKTRTTEQALELYAEAVRLTEGAEAKAVLAKKAFGEAGADLVPILERGAMGLAEMRKQATDTATAIDERTTKAAKALRNEIDLLTTEATNSLANKLAPALEVVNRAFKQYREGGGFQGIADRLAPKDSSDKLKSLGVGVAMVADQLDRAKEAAARARESIGAWQTVTVQSELGKKPDYTGQDQIMAAVAALAAARGETSRAIALEGQTAIEQARRLLEERRITEEEFGRIRSTISATTEARIVDMRKQAKEQLNALEAEALTARGEGFEAVRSWMNAELLKYQEMVKAKAITEAQFQQARENLNAIASEKIKAETERLKQEVEANTKDIAAAFEQAIGGTLTGQFETASEAARHFGQTLLKALQDAITKALILEPIMKSIRGGLSNSMPNGIEGFAASLGSMFGLGGGSGWQSTVTPGRAEGGALHAGLASRVNERPGRLPEVFVPDTSGRMVPGERARGMAAAGGSQTSNVYNIDARGADAGVSSRVVNAIAAAEAQRARSIEQQRSFARRFPMRG